MSLTWTAASWNAAVSFRGRRQFTTRRLWLIEPLPSVFVFPILCLWGAFSATVWSGMPATPVAVAPGAQQRASEEGAPAAEREEPAVELTRPILDASLRLGRSFMLSNQLPNGLFRYRFHFLTQQSSPEQNVVRQAGALWGLALIHHDQPSVETRGALLRGFEFHSKQSRRTEDGRRYLRFPGAAEGDSGAVALVALALIDFLRAEGAEEHAPLRRQLDEYLLFLRSLERSDHRFHGKYLWESGEGWGSPSPYADGEILLAMVKAARYAGHRDVQATVLRSADAAYLAYADPVLQGSRDASHEGRAKGFFQWGCMAYVELVELGWPGSDAYSSRAIRMAHWMIDVHGTLQRRRNTSYAQEGIISAYQLACLAGDRASGEKFRSAVAQGLGRLTTWQIGGPVPCTYLRDNRTDDPRSVGGVLDAPADPMLRIDTTQHQMHAVILARRHVFRDEGPLRDGHVE